MGRLWWGAPGGGEGLAFLALAELEDWPTAPSLDLIPAFSSWLFPPSLLLPLLEKGLSLLSFQLCNSSVTRNVQKVEAVQTLHVTYAPCGGWIPWRRCPKTVYRTRYLTVEVPEARNVTDCCAGYEQLGLYCVLRESGVASGRGAGDPS